MDRLDAMHVLLAAVESGSLSKASRRLGLPLTTVSRKVADLESHLNASLLLRSAKGLELTPAGRSYVTGAKSILEQLNEIERSVAGEYTQPKGDLVVTAPVMFGRLHMLCVVTGFLAAYPDVSVNLDLTDRVTDFMDDHVDVALRIGELPDSDLVAVRLGSVRRVVCASPAYLREHGHPSTPDQLARHVVVAFDNVSSPTNWVFESGGSETTMKLRARLGVNTIDAAIAAALDGAGLIRAMSYQIVELVRAGRLEVVLQDFAPSPRPVQLVYDKRGRLPLKLRAFVDFATPVLRERVAGAELRGK